MNENISQELMALRAQISLIESRLQSASDNAESAIYDSPRQAQSEASVHPPYYPSTDAADILIGNKLINNINNGEQGYGANYSFRAFINDSGYLQIETGDVWMGPLTVIEWASITSATINPNVSSTDTHLWLEIDVSNESAVMVYGSKTAMKSALDSNEQRTKLVCPLVETTWTGTVLTKVKNLQCGDVLIPRL